MPRKSNKPKFPKLLDSLFKNQLVLYIVLIVALVNIVGYFYNSDYTSLILFIIVGIIIKCFTNNMTLILLVPIIVVNVLVAGHVFTQVKAYEGLANKKDKDRPLPEFEGLAGIQRQQKQIMENITTLGPILKDATSLLKKVDMNQVNKVMGKMSQDGGAIDLANSFRNKKK